MSDSTNLGARGAWPPRASGPPSTPAADIRARAVEEIELLGNLDVPPLHELDLDTATPAEFRTAVMRFVETHYEDDEQVRERLNREISDMRAARLAYENAVVDEIHAAVRDDRYELARLPTLEVLRARRQTYPDPRPMTQAPGWPDPLVPGTGRTLSELQTESGAA